MVKINQLPVNTSQQPHGTHVSDDRPPLTSQTAPNTNGIRCRTSVNFVQFQFHTFGWATIELSWIFGGLTHSCCSVLLCRVKCIKPASHDFLLTELKVL